VNAVTVAALLVAALALALAGALVLVRARDRRRAAPLARDREQSERAAIERQAALERAVVRLESELVAVYGEVRRVADSRSWRYAHALSMLASTLMGRRPAGSDSAVGLLVERLETLELPSDGTPLLVRSGLDGGGSRAVRRARPGRGRTQGGPPARPSASDGRGVELLIVALGMTESQLQSLLETLSGPSGRALEGVLLVIDTDAFGLMREAGCRFEFVPPREDWQRHFPDNAYEDFVRARLTELQGAYAPPRTLALGEAADLVLAGLAMPLSPAPQALARAPVNDRAMLQEGTAAPE